VHHAHLRQRWLLQGRCIEAAFCFSLCVPGTSRLVAFTATVSIITTFWTVHRRSSSTSTRDVIFAGAAFKATLATIPLAVHVCV
jgi:hypothetical protein